MGAPHVSKWFICILISYIININIKNINVNININMCLQICGILSAFVTGL
jgi:hypothetical protein